MVLMILFWILWLVWVVGYFAPLTGNVQRAHDVISAILVGVLGYKLFGNPLDK